MYGSVELTDLGGFMRVRADGAGLQKHRASNDGQIWKPFTGMDEVIFIKIPDIGKHWASQVMILTVCVMAFEYIYYTDTHFLAVVLKLKKLWSQQSGWWKLLLPWKQAMCTHKRSCHNWKVNTHIDITQIGCCLDNNIGEKNKNSGEERDLKKKSCGRVTSLKWYRYEKWVTVCVMLQSIRQWAHPLPSPQNFHQEDSDEWWWESSSPWNY